MQMLPKLEPNLRWMEINVMLSSGVRIWMFLWWYEHFSIIIKTKSPVPVPQMINLLHAGLSFSLSRVSQRSHLSLVLKTPSKHIHSEDGPLQLAHVLHWCLCFTRFLITSSTYFIPFGVSCNSNKKFTIRNKYKVYWLSPKQQTVFEFYKDGDAQNSIAASFDNRHQ